MNKMESQDFQHIATTVRPKLMNLCQRFFDRQELAYDAEDAVQETLIRLWQMRVRIGDYQKPEALAMLIAKNVCIDILKLSKEQHETLDETANVITAAVPGLSPSRLYKNRRYRPLKQLIHHTLRCILSYIDKEYDNILKIKNIYLFCFGIQICFVSLQPE